MALTFLFENFLGGNQNMKSLIFVNKNCSTTDYYIKARIHFVFICFRLCINRMSNWIFYRLLAIIHNMYIIPFKVFRPSSIFTETYTNIKEKCNKWTWNLKCSLYSTPPSKAIKFHYRLVISVGSYESYTFYTYHFSSEV